jgi:hypothetical protein
LLSCDGTILERVGSRRGGGGRNHAGNSGAVETAAIFGNGDGYNWNFAENLLANETGSVSSNRLCVAPYTPYNYPRKRLLWQRGFLPVRKAEDMNYALALLTVTLLNVGGPHGVKPVRVTNGVIEVTQARGCGDVAHCISARPERIALSRSGRLKVQIPRGRYSVSGRVRGRSCETKSIQVKKARATITLYCERS